MLQVHSLAFDYQDTPLLNAVNFSLASGKLLHLCGGNGTGKTTLLRVLTGFLTPTSGTIYWNNRPIEEDLRSYQHALCYVGHKMGLSLELSVKENCYFDPHWPKKPFDFKE